ncbi:MAG: V-type ATP synthase subunit D [Ruminococcaceae bacterium]|nr:V-type ATP synthase subunit D [Oscillospiraceae bacterium]
MAELRVNPTRMELKKIQARYATARKGHKLLKDKRDELMKRFLDVVREDKLLRQRVEASLSGVYKSFGIASAVSSPNMLTEALMLPKKEGKLDVTYKNVMSVTVPVYSLEILGEGGSDSYNYGMAFTSGELDSSLRELNGILEDLVRMAELEKTAQMLAEEIEKTRRRVNALEHIMMPQYVSTMKTIKMKLDENERGNTTRLMKVKDMMVKAQMAGRNDGAESDEEYSEVTQ